MLASWNEPLPSGSMQAQVSRSSCASTSATSSHASVEDLRSRECSNIGDLGSSKSRPCCENARLCISFAIHSPDLQTDEKLVRVNDVEEKLCLQSPWRVPSSCAFSPIGLHPESAWNWFGRVYGVS